MKQQVVERGGDPVKRLLRNVKKVRIIALTRKVRQYNFNMGYRQEKAQLSHQHDQHG